MLTRNKVMPVIIGLITSMLDFIFSIPDKR